jgi:hypothetical protein
MFRIVNVAAKAPVELIRLGRRNSLLMVLCFEIGVHDPIRMAPKAIISSIVSY